MPKDSKQLERELERLKDKVDSLSGKTGKKEVTLPSDELSGLVKYMIDYMREERERTNRALTDMAEAIKKTQSAVANTMYQEDEVDASQQLQRGMGNREVPLSDLDVKIINFAQVKGMVCAEDVKQFMGYRGNNAACARLNKLYKDGLLDRFQLGHKVYYKFDAGKTTNTLIISPPQ